MAMIAAEADIVAIPQTFSRTPSNTANAACPETENAFGSTFYIDIFAQHLSQHLVESAHAVQVKGIDGGGGLRHHDRDSPLRHMRSHHRPPHRRHGQISHSERSCASRHCIDRGTCVKPCPQYHDSSGACSLTVLSTKQFIDGIFRWLGKVKHAVPSGRGECASTSQAPGSLASPRSPEPLEREAPGRSARTCPDVCGLPRFPPPPPLP